VTKRLPAWRATIAIAMVIAAAPGCLVLGLDRFYDQNQIEFDERLIGTWIDADDNVTVTIERSEWRSYRLQYVHPIEKGALTGYLFREGAHWYMDLTPIRGQDFGSFVVPAHALVRLTWRDQDLTVVPLSYDWFHRAVQARTAPAALVASLGERDQVVLAAGRTALRAWLTGLADGDPAFGAAATFKRQ
jgi:hypothetical protein